MVLNDQSINEIISLKKELKEYDITLTEYLLYTYKDKLDMLDLKLTRLPSDDPFTP